MKPQYNKTINTMLAEIRTLAKNNLPKGVARQISNRCDRISVTSRKRGEEPDEEAKERVRYNAQQAILEALVGGRKLSQLDCKEFMVEDMRTPISHLKGKYPVTHELKSEWIISPVRGSRIKRYWLEAREA